MSDGIGSDARGSGSALEPISAVAGEGIAPPWSRVTALTRALRLDCPNCGKARLLRGYLKQVDACPSCGEHFGHIRSDDAAPWLTILIVGHVLVPLMVAIESADIWPQAVSIIFWPAAGILLAGLVLPRAKALFISLIWFEKSPGSERDRGRK